MGLSLAICFIGGSGRKPSRIDWGAAIASLGIAAYMGYRVNTSAPIPPILFPCLAITLVWMVIGGRAWAMRWFDWTAAALSLVICLYITVRYEPLTYEIALLPPEGIIGSAILVLLVLEATRRTAGATLVGIILILIVYVFIGPHLPGDFQTRPVTPERLLVYFGLDVNGMIGPLLGVAVLIVVPFTLMGQVLGRTGGAAYFADIAMSGMGKFRGGAAKIAVVGSALFGMISGAAVSNVVAVGIVTIPLMARSGFSPYASGGDRIGRLDRWPAHAARDGRRRLHHGGVPSGFVWRGLHRGRHSVTALLRRPVHARRPRSREAEDRRGPGRRRGALVPSGPQVRLALSDPDRVSHHHHRLSGSFPDPDRAGGGLLHRHPDRAVPVVRLSRQEELRRRDHARGARYRARGARHRADRRGGRHGGGRAQHLRHLVRAHAPAHRDRGREPVHSAAAHGRSSASSSAWACRRSASTC